jgi:hypothetical protein
MNVPTMEMDKAEARERLRAYRKALIGQANSEYAEAARGYAALARGTKLLMPSQVFADVPVDAKGRPKLAIIRADVRQAGMTKTAGSFRFWNADRGHHATMVAQAVGVQSAAATGVRQDGYALVPMVPPDVLGNRNLNTHWILWEVEAWADRIIGARADRDPYLLRRISRDLYAVVGEWDLTELERAVMQRRALD